MSIGEDLRCLGKKLKAWFSVLFGLGIILYFGGAFVVFIYQGIDATGNISHTETTDITVSSNWLIGEIKECTSPVLHDGSQPRKPYGYALGFITCDDSPLKTFKVTFYGRREQGEYSDVEWSCIREPATFTCKQTGGTRKPRW
jgi:hypothetical protein